MSALWASSHGKGVINIGKGHPNPTYLPTTEVADAYKKALSTLEVGRPLLQYGRMQGNADFCAELCSWLQNKAGRKKLTAEEILITTGSGPGLSLCCQLYSSPGDTIFIDSPAYFLTFYTFRDCRLKIVEIPTDENGMDIDVVESRLRSGERPKLLYTVPICNNPTGVTLSNERRRRLVELSREFDFKILADEVYQMLAWDSDTNPATGFFDLDDPKKPTVFAISSFSKLLGPGIRVGWIETDQVHINRLLNNGALQSGGGANPLGSGMVLELIRSGFVDQHVSMLRNKYKICCDTMTDALDKYVSSALKPGEHAKYFRPKGGFFCFVTLPERFETQELLEFAMQHHGVSYFSGKNFCDGSSEFDDALRLCFAFLCPDAIEEGIRRLGKAVAEYDARKLCPE